ncbi:DUF4126 domain-containing protein [Nocardia farcinica]|uniref:DUF4126 domain-containing protein n=1 Tax=Nocardia farcinica TaxID=37329 RepID=UPI003CC7F9B9
MSLLPLIFTAGWASGINAYAVVLLLGLFGVTGLSDEVPAGLQRADVLIAAAVLFAIEAVADKIPYLDSFWDSLHTVVRPAAGAVVAALIAGSDESLTQLAAAAVGGTTALVSHLVKGRSPDGDQHLTGTRQQHRHQRRRGRRGGGGDHAGDLPSAGRGARGGTAAADRADGGRPAGRADPPVPAAVARAAGAPDAADGLRA